MRNVLVCQLYTDDNPGNARHAGESLQYISSSPGSTNNDGTCFFYFFSGRRRHTRWPRDWSSDVCSSDLRGHGSVRVDDRGQLDVIGRQGAQQLDQDIQVGHLHEEEPTQTLQRLGIGPLGQGDLAASGAHHRGVTLAVGEGLTGEDLDTLPRLAGHVELLELTHSLCLFLRGRGVPWWNIAVADQHHQILHRVPPSSRRPSCRHHHVACYLPKSTDPAIVVEIRRVTTGERCRWGSIPRGDSTLRCSLFERAFDGMSVVAGSVVVMFSNAASAAGPVSAGTGAGGGGGVGGGTAREEAARSLGGHPGARVLARLKQYLGHEPADGAVMLEMVAACARLRANIDGVEAEILQGLQRVHPGNALGEELAARLSITDRKSTRLNS